MTKCGRHIEAQQKLRTAIGLQPGSKQLHNALLESIKTNNGELAQCANGQNLKAWVERNGGSLPKL
jgi:hypothetical protein